ncbi:MAG: N-acetylglucosamine kinase [Fidelibacterota bacterium]
MRRNMDGDRWILSVDGGGTKTDLLLLNSPERYGIQMTGRGANPNVHGASGLDTMEGLITDALGHVGGKDGDVRECITGMAGISNPKYRTDLEGRMSVLLPKAELRLTTDAELAHRGVWGDGAGITLVVGTGSIAVGTDQSGNMRRAGGFGFQSGDEGGGFWLGKMILAELIAGERSTATDISEMREKVLEHAGQSNLEETLSLLSAGRESVMKVANLAPVILECAESGNFLASQIVIRGVEALVSLMEELLEKLPIKSSEPSVGISGSLICGSSYYRNLVGSELSTLFNAVHWRQSDFPPVYGGLVLSGEGISTEDFPKIRVEHVQPSR